MEYFTGLFLLLGGIGLFLYGINFMSKGLERAAGDNLRNVLEKATSNGFFAIGVGTLMTALIQSSGATSVMVTGFVDAGLMKLSQAVFIMLGANIGTTVTAQIITFKITSIAPLILFVGVVMYMFIKKRTIKRIGEIVLGFGILFVGIYLMGESVGMLNLSEIVEKFLKNFSNPILSILFGIAITAIIQSSSASIGILQVLATSLAGSVIGLDAVFYMILGMNIGACSPVVIASFSGKRGSKRAALADLMIKIFGAAFFIILTAIFPSIKDWIVSLSPNDISRQIANLHLLFNIVSSIALFPFAKLIARLIEKILPDKEQDITDTAQLIYINPKITLSPSVAISQTTREILRMAKLMEENIRRSIDIFFQWDFQQSEKVKEVEQTINFLNHQITGYLVGLHGQNLPSKELEKVGMMFHVVSDIERIGDHAENISEYAQIRKDKNVQFSKQALEELRSISERSLQAISLAVDIYSNERFDMLNKMTMVEEDVDRMQETYIENHIERLKNHICKPREGVMFTDMVTDLERCSDHAINIAYAINGEKNVIEIKKAYIVTRGQN